MQERPPAYCCPPLMRAATLTRCLRRHLTKLVIRGCLDTLGAPICFRCLFDSDQLIAQLVSQTYPCEKGEHPQHGCLSRWIVTTDLPSEADRCMDLLLPSDLHAPDLLGRRRHTLGLTLRWFAADNKSVGAERRHHTLVCSRMQKLQQHTGVNTGLLRSTLGT